MVRKASTRKRQTKIAGKKKLVVGVDFAPPEPIASVLPRIQLTSSQADDLWALVCKGRRRDPNNEADAEMAKAILADSDLANAVQQALQFYVRDVIFLSDIPEFRRRLKTLHNRVARFSLPCRRNMILLITFLGGRTPARYFCRISCVQRTRASSNCSKSGRRSMVSRR
jgi:hypothetical protein